MLGDLSMYDFKPFWNFTELHETIEKCKDLCKALSNGVDNQTYWRLYVEISRQCGWMQSLIQGSKEAFLEALQDNGTYVVDANWFEQVFYPEAEKRLAPIAKLSRNFYDDDYENCFYQQNAWNLFHALEPFEDLVAEAINLLAM